MDEGDQASPKESAYIEEDRNECLSVKSSSGSNLLSSNRPGTDSSTSGQDDFICSLYISRAPGPQGGELSCSILEAAIGESKPLAGWHVSETPCGLIAAFMREADAERLLQKDLARIFEGPVQVARFCGRDSRYRQALLLRDVPWAIPLQDLHSALTKQGITTGSIERVRQFVRVEVLNAGHYELLLRQGLDFFGAARFSAIPERWWRCLNGQLQTAPRCVRCGEPHSVEFCPRPRNNPICCHCSGPHHAGYRQCPVRQQLSNATPISITLSTARIGNQYPTSISGKQSASSLDEQPVKSNLS